MMKLENLVQRRKLRTLNSNRQLLFSVLDCKRSVSNTIGGVPLGVAKVTGIGD